MTPTLHELFEEVLKRAEVIKVLQLEGVEITRERIDDFNDAKRELDKAIAELIKL